MTKTKSILAVILTASLMAFLNPMYSNISAQQGNESLPEASQQPSPLAGEQLQRAQNQVQLAQQQTLTQQNTSLTG